jgi:hypothetical protein
MKAHQTAGWRARGLEAHRREGDGWMVLGWPSWRLHQSRAAAGSHAEAGGHGGRGTGEHGRNHDTVNETCQ